MKDYIFPPNRPTPSSRGTTKFENEVLNPEKEKKYTKFYRCLICGFPNKDSATQCAFCGSKNWRGKYD